MEQEKKDCFAYRTTKTEGQYCSVLKKLYCEYEECKFYKKKEKEKCN